VQNYSLRYKNYQYAPRTVTHVTVCEHNVEEDISTADTAIIGKTGSEIWITK